MPVCVRVRVRREEKGRGCLFTVFPRNILVLVPGSSVKNGLFRDLQSMENEPLSSFLSLSLAPRGRERKSKANQKGVNSRSPKTVCMCVCVSCVVI